MGFGCLGTYDVGVQGGVFCVAAQTKLTLYTLASNEIALIIFWTFGSCAGPEK